MDTIVLLLAIVAAFWFGIVSAVFLGGLIISILAAVLAGLKVGGIIGWSWWWVTLPIWTLAGGMLAKTWIARRNARISSWR